MSKYLKVTAKEFKAISDVVASAYASSGSACLEFIEEADKGDKAVKAVIKRNEGKHHD